MKRTKIRCGKTICLYAEPSNVIVSLRRRHVMCNETESLLREGFSLQGASKQNTSNNLAPVFERCNLEANRGRQKAKHSGRHHFGVAAPPFFYCFSVSQK